MNQTAHDDDDELYSNLSRMSDPRSIVDGYDGGIPEEEALTGVDTAGIGERFDLALDVIDGRLA